MQPEGMVSRSEEDFDDREVADIRAAIRTKYSEVAHSALGKFQYATGYIGACNLGYDRELLDTLDQTTLDAFCGVGNPFRLGGINKGAAVLDVGCGAGFDLIVASRQVGRGGRVCGVDLTAEMVRRARHNLQTAGVENVEIEQIDGEILPYGDKSFDVVLSNGVINLSPRKQLLFQEIFRVLKPGGRLQFADMVREKELPGPVAASVEAWAQ